MTTARHFRFPARVMLAMRYLRMPKIRHVGTAHGSDRVGCPGALRSCSLSDGTPVVRECPRLPRVTSADLLEAARVDVIDEATDREPGEVWRRAHALDVRAERRLLVTSHEERQAPRVGAARCLDRAVHLLLAGRRHPAASVGDDHRPIDAEQIEGEHERAQHIAQLHARRPFAEDLRVARPEAEHRERLDSRVDAGQLFRQAGAPPARRASAKLGNRPNTGGSPRVPAAKEWSLRNSERIVGTPRMLCSCSDFISPEATNPPRAQ